MTDAPVPLDSESPTHDARVDQILGFSESRTFDCKRLKGKLTKVLETVVAFANSDGGIIALGLEDPDKARGRDRLYGIQENLMNWDELRRLLRSRITEPDSLSWTPLEIACTLREFPRPPNLDAGEGVRMMFGTMWDTGLYSPVYLTRPTIEREVVVVYLFNENRPSIWEQVTKFIDKNGTIGNSEVRQLMDVDTLKASRQIREWVERGFLVIANPQAGKRLRRYTRPDFEPTETLFPKASDNG